ncbi:type II secretion system protein [uncultured Clostridium sp.]|uniref:type II secretion system protein n=1 Tax=uncultured Clostridium sp. TaxID=59620 RepID=UPI002583C016|nr:prepilin-type N-terminal cleavage/methylation domain-containing protein [uncultured Clostridium sp.]
MRNLIKSKKKKGFTLIEMVAVVAIIGILAAILIPKITGYMDEAKKTVIVNQARQVVQAVEGAKLKGEPNSDFANKEVVNITNEVYKALLDGADISKLGSTMKYEACLAIVNEKADFTMDPDGNFAATK